MRFSTYYRQSGQLFASHVYALSREEAAEFCELRGIGEWLDDALPTADSTEPTALFHVDNSSPEVALHALVWLGYLAVSSGVASVEDVLGDFGFLHESIHELAGVKGAPDDPTRLESIRSSVEVIQSLIPGYLPVGGVAS